jgi:hypothetical protein
VLVSSAAEPHALYFGTQYVMKTLDGGLHWETISADLTGAASIAKSLQAQPPALDDAMRLGYGVVSTIAPSPLNREVIWAGSDTGLIHVTRDAGKSWKDVTPPELNAWSAVSLIEASHFDPATAYAAVSRSRLDDQTPYIYRTRDYGATWQPITQGIAASHFLRAVREDPHARGLLFAGTELGVYLSFDDGDHWQPLQLNLPVCSVRDLTIHDDDLVIATHGRSFWILDDITPLRQIPDAAKAKGSWLYQPATAIRIDNDSFSGTPLPPEEPTAENPPSGGIIDYVLGSSVKAVTLEVFDAQQELVRRFSSADQPAKHGPVAIADHWFPKPEVLGTGPGMHRFVWNLSWGTSEEPESEEAGSLRLPNPPKVQPGTYRLRLTADGESKTQSLKVVMDPRSPATPEVLAKQFETGRQIYDEAMVAYRTLIELKSVQKQLADLQARPAAQDADIKSHLADAKAAIDEIIADKTHVERPGLQDAYRNMTSTLRVVEGGDRPAPAQALTVYRESSEQIKARAGEWTAFKKTTIPALNQRLRQAGLLAITVPGD